MAAGWDADRYQRQFGYASRPLAATSWSCSTRPWGTVLDLGRGGAWRAGRATGARVLALDSDPAMVAAACWRLGDDRVLLADGHAFSLDEPVDAVFSNAGFCTGCPGRPR